MHTHLTAGIATTLALFGFPCASAAQVPPGHLAISSLAAPGSGYPTGGVTIVDPVLGASTSLTGLPADVLGTTAPPNGIAGGNAILVDDNDGSFLVGTYSGASGVALNLHRIVPAGSAAVVIQTIAIGTTGTVGGGIDQMAWLSPTSIAVSYRGLPSLSPVRGIARIDLMAATPTPTPLTISPPLAAISNALAISRDASTLYFVQDTPAGSNLLRVPVGGGASSLVAALPNGVYQLAVEHSGNVIAATWPSGLYEVDPMTGTFWQRSTISQPNAMTIDRTTGRIAALSANPGFTSGEWIDPTAWTSTPIAGVPSTIAASGIAVRSSMVPYGSACPSPNGTSTWLCSPNAGGAPQRGNMTFAVNVALAGTTGQFGLVALSLGSLAPVTVPPFCGLLIDPLQVGVLAVHPTATTCTVPLPIPLGIPPLEVFAQTFHPDASGAWFGSEGLRVMVF